MHLLDGERLEIEKTKFEDGLFDEDAINEKYGKGEKRIITEQGRYPLDSLNDILEKSITLKPSYQRSFVWNSIQKSRLIESFIMNIPIPPVFLYETDLAKLEVMDGRQRLTTIKDFYNDIFSLEGLEIWHELNGKKYSELPEKVQKGIDRRYISTIVILNETAKNKEEEQELKQYVFERLNTGGTKLSDQETRNAILDGPMNALCKRLALTSESFNKIYGIDEDAKNKAADLFELDLAEYDFRELYEDGRAFVRMEDVELVLRFFAYRQIDTNENTQVKKILDSYLKFANVSFTEQLREELAVLFNSTMDTILNIFKEKSFRMYSKKRNLKTGTSTFSWNEVPAKSIYDPIVMVFSDLVAQNKTIEYKTNYQDFIKSLEQFFEKNDGQFDARNNLKSHVLIRKKLFEEFIQMELNIHD